MGIAEVLQPVSELLVGPGRADGAMFRIELCTVSNTHQDYRTVFIDDRYWIICCSYRDRRYSDQIMCAYHRPGEFRELFVREGRALVFALISLQRAWQLVFPLLELLALLLVQRLSLVYVNSNKKIPAQGF